MASRAPLPSQSRRYRHQSRQPNRDVLERVFQLSRAKSPIIREHQLDGAE
jgi:hypothetical protein